MAGGRPKADDPKTQVAIYPPTSIWERFKAIAARRGKKPAVLVAELVTETVEQDRADA